MHFGWSHAAIFIFSMHFGWSHAAIFLTRTSILQVRMPSLPVNEQTDGSTPQETCILILFETYILHRQGPGSNFIRKISTIFSYMISFIVFKKLFKKLLLSVVCSSSPNFS